MNTFRAEEEEQKSLLLLLTSCWLLLLLVQCLTSRRTTTRRSSSGSGCADQVSSVLNFNQCCSLCSPVTEGSGTAVFSSTMFLHFYIFFFVQIVCTEGLLIRMLRDTSFVDTGEFTNAHADVISAPGSHTIVFIDSFTSGYFASGVLDSTDLLILPEQERGAFYPSLSLSDKEALRSFTEGRGRVILMGDSSGRAETFINGIYGTSVSSSSCSSGSAHLTEGGQEDMIFADGPMSVSYANAVYCLSLSSLPSDAVVIYAQSSSSYVTSFYDGQLIHLGFDWYLGSGMVGWEDILHLAISAPISRTAAPTLVPSLSMSPTLSQEPSRHPVTSAPSFSPTEGLLIRMLRDTSFVDTGEFTNSHADVISAPGFHTIVFIDSFTSGYFASGVLDSTDLLILPEQERGAFYPSLSLSDKEALRSFTEGRGRVILMGDNSGRAETFINGIYGTSVSSSSCSSGSAHLTEGGQEDMIFADGPMTVSYANAVYCLSSSSLPTDAVVIYAQSSSSYVTSFYDGQLIHLGFDWYAGSGLVGWEDILHLAISAPMSRTAAPTLVPSLSMSPTLSQEPSRHPVTSAPSFSPTEGLLIRMLRDTSFVDTGEFTNAHADVISAPGFHTIVFIDSFTSGYFASGVLDSTDLLILPEQERGAFYPSLSLFDKEALRSFTEGRGRVILMGDNSGRAETFINGIYGTSVSSSSCSSGSAHLTEGGQEDTIFADGPMSVSYANAVYCLSLSSLPSEAVVIYAQSSSSYATSFYDGQLIHLGFDWYAGSGVVGWEDILHLAISAPISRTAAPTLVPSLSMSPTLSQEPSRHPVTSAPSFSPTEGLLIRMLRDTSFVDTGEFANAHADVISAPGFHTIVFIDSFTSGYFASGVLDSTDLLILPEQEMSSFYPSLSLSDKEALRSFTEGRGRVILMGDNSGRAETFINGIYGTSVSSSSCSSGSAHLTEGGQKDPIFAHGPISVSYANAVYCLSSSSLPSDAVVIYAQSSSSYVTSFYDGKLIHLGFDWFAGSGMVGWEDILHLAIDAPVTAIPSPLPTFLPTGIPTLPPCDGFEVGEPRLDDRFFVTPENPVLNVSWEAAECTSDFVFFMLCRRENGGGLTCYNTNRDTNVFGHRDAFRNKGSAVIIFRNSPSNGNGHYILRVVDDENPEVSGDSAIFRLDFSEEMTIQEGGGDDFESSSMTYLYISLGLCVAAILLCLLFCLCHRRKKLDSHQQNDPDHHIVPTAPPLPFSAVELGDISKSDMRSYQEQQIDPVQLVYAEVVSNESEALVTVDLDATLVTLDLDDYECVVDDDGSRFGNGTAI